MLSGISGIRGEVYIDPNAKSLAIMGCGEEVRGRAMHEKMAVIAPIESLKNVFKIICSNLRISKIFLYKF